MTPEEEYFCALCIAKCPFDNKVLAGSLVLSKEAESMGILLIIWDIPRYASVLPPVPFLFFFFGCKFGLLSLFPFLGRLIPVCNFDHVTINLQLYPVDFRTLYGSFHISPQVPNWNAHFLFLLSLLQFALIFSYLTVKDGFRRKTKTKLV